MHYVVAIPIDKKLAEFIGKGGAEGSINFYNRKIDEDVIVGLAPSSIEDKFYAVAETFLIAQQILISTANIDKLFGELVVACSLLGKHVIFTDENDIANILSGIKVGDYEISSREELIQKILSKKTVGGEGGIRVDIDHAFPVKGIGSVVLGIVTRGTLKVHDELHHSSGKVISIKSIQSQDIDIQNAGVGTRVGLAVKGIEHDEISKGDLFTKNKMQRVSQTKAAVTVSSIAKEEIAAGSRYTMVANFSDVNVLVEQIAGNEITFKLERPLPLEKGDQFLLIREKAPRIFAVGTIA
ncbi:MAG: EF-Tu/IF-2/RF-3 family GTPase [Candidatus Micrarchaeales archaeon]